MPTSPTATCPQAQGPCFEVEGRRLRLHRAGAGGPAVVFLPGAGLVGLDYLNVHEAVARFTTSVLYDRGGTGWSDPVPLPRTAADVAGELRRLLRAADIAPPFVLVGHSLGGAYARRFAQLFPDETAGLVFLDPAHEGYASMPKPSLLAQARMGLAMIPAALDMKRFYRPLFERMLAAWPQDARQSLIDYHLRNWRKSIQEAANLQGEVLGEIGEGGAVPDVPLVVLTAMGIDPFQAAFLAKDYLRDLNAKKRTFYDAFAASSPRGQNRTVDAGHSTLHTDRPGAVVDAIRDVVTAARRERPAPGPALASGGATAKLAACTGS